MRLLAAIMLVVLTSACSLLFRETPSDEALATDGAAPADDSTAGDAADLLDAALDAVDAADPDAQGDVASDAAANELFEFHVNCPAMVQCTCSALEDGMVIVEGADPNPTGGGQASCKMILPASTSLTLVTGGCPGTVTWTGDDDCSFIIATTCSFTVAAGQPGITASCN